jgi:polyhydroxybutyrate depolymerase
VTARAFVALLLPALLAACKQAPPAVPGPLGDRPYQIDLPPGAGSAGPLPVLLLLHPYNPRPERFAEGLGIGPAAAARGLIVVSPRGLTDRQGNAFWNATDTCCDFDGRGSDDVAYLKAVLADVRARYRVDEGRIYALGFSNGAFMAYRLSCEGVGLAGIVAIAGATWKDPARCRAERPVAVLHVQGDADEIVPFGGGVVTRRLPGGPRPPVPAAVESVGFWAARDGCAGADEIGTLDVDAAIPGAESRIERWRDCRAGGVELWTVAGGRHNLSFTSQALGAMLDFLLAYRAE